MENMFRTILIILLFDKFKLLKGFFNDFMASWSIFTIIRLYSERKLL